MTAEVCRAARARAVSALLVFVLGVALHGPASAGVDPAARCQSRQLKAASKLCKSVLRCQAKVAKSAAFDAASCANAAVGRFTATYQKALDRAAAAGGSCGLADAAASVADDVRSPAETVAAEVLEGLAPAFRADAAFRRRLLKAGANYCGSSFRNWSKYAVKGSLAKLGDGSAKARAKWVRTTEKAIDKVQGQGVDYTGLAPAEVGVRVDGLVGPLAAASAPEPEIAEASVSTALSESLVMQVRTTAGDLFEYFGDKDPVDGSPTRLRSIRTVNARGEAITYEIDDQARPSRFFLPDGTILGIEWVSETELVVEAVSGDGEFRTYLPAAVPSTLSGLAIPGVPARRPLPRAATSSIVTVSACGDPVVDGHVEVLLDTAAEPRTVVATHVGGGSYEARFGVGDPLGDAESACMLADLLFDGTEHGFRGIRPEFLDVLCPRVAAAVARVPGAAAWGAKVLPTCVVVIGSMNLLRPEAPDCGQVRAWVSGLIRGLTVDVRALVMAEGIEFQQAEPRFDQPAAGPYPDFNVEAKEDGPIVPSFFTVPASPAPLVDYVATASLACVEAGTEVLMTVLGTDGYANATTCTMTGNTGSCGLFVLGAPTGVVDAVAVTVGEVEKLIYVEF